MAYPIRLTLGHVLRHAPASSAAGFDAACIDIAQDLLLRQLTDQGLLDMVAFKSSVAAGATSPTRPTSAARPAA